MNRRAAVRPRLESLEDRLPPGDLLTWLVPSALFAGAGLAFPDRGGAASGLDAALGLGGGQLHQPGALDGIGAVWGAAETAPVALVVARAPGQTSGSQLPPMTPEGAADPGTGRGAVSPFAAASPAAGNPLNLDLFTIDGFPVAPPGGGRLADAAPAERAAGGGGGGTSGNGFVPSAGHAPEGQLGVAASAAQPGSVPAGNIAPGFAGSIVGARVPPAGPGSGARASVTQGATDPYTLYTYGDAYTGAPGQDRASFLARYHPDPALLDGAAHGSPVGGQIVQNDDIGTPDPGVPGPLDVTTQEYTFGNTAFHPTGFPGPGVELTGEVTAPTDLSNGPYPLIVLLHGRHATTYDPNTDQVSLEWPATANHLPIPSYQGYEYLANNLASHGYIVVSISANGINAQDNNVTDLGASARAQLVQRQLDVWRDLDTGDGTVQPFGVAPFGTRFVGEVDLQNIGTMGHSRGGEGVVQNYLLNRSLGSPYGITAVFDIAPVDFNRPVPSDVPFAVLLSYNDGDVSDLQGIHFYDDARYADPADAAPKHSIEVMGGNHNFYNTVWSPGQFPAGAVDEGVSGPPTRLTEAQQQAVGNAYMAAFFRTYVGNAAVPGTTAFAPLLNGDEAPPPSSQVTADQVFLGYQSGAGSREDVNRLSSTGNLTVNTLGGAVQTGGLNTYQVYGGVGETRYVLPGEPSAHFPHTIPSAVASSVPGLSQLRLGYQNTTSAFYENDIPAADADVSGFYDFQFRVATEYTDARNPAGQSQDFSVTLTDQAGDAYTTQVSTWSGALFHPVGLGGANPTPHDLLNTVRIPLTAFLGVDLTSVASVVFTFDQRTSGAFLFADLAFADPANVYAGPFVTSSTPAQNASALPGTTSLQVRFNTPIDPASFTPDQAALTAPDGTAIPVTSITPIDGTSDTQFSIGFDPLATAGSYTLTVGPNVLDKFGNPMDQNLNGVAGQVPNDQFVLQFGVASPAVVSTTLTGTFNHQVVDHGRLVFNEPIDPGSFTPDQFSLVDPDGNPVNVTGINPVDDTDTQFDVTFDPQATLGTYTVTVGPNLVDFYGNPMTGPFTSQFSLINELVVNGGFETGNFSGWTQSGNTGATGVDGGNVHSGHFAAFLGPAGSEGFLTQTLPTTAGTTYHLTYWLEHDGGSPSSFHAMIDGVDIPGSVLTNPPAFAYTPYAFDFTANGPTTQLRFGFREDPTYFHLDDVSVSP
jgi:methionine-rich copper-binding protein CopC